MAWVVQVLHAQSSGQCGKAVNVAVNGVVLQSRCDCADTSR